MDFCLRMTAAGLAFIAAACAFAMVALVVLSVAMRHLAAAVMVAFCLWFTIEALPWLDFAFRRTLKSESSRLLLYPWMATAPLSLALTGLIAITRLARPAAHRSDDRPPA